MDGEASSVICQHAKRIERDREQCRRVPQDKWRIGTPMASNPGPNPSVQTIANRVRSRLPPMIGRACRVFPLSEQRRRLLWGRSSLRRQGLSVKGLPQLRGSAPEPSLATARQRQPRCWTRRRWRWGLERVHLAMQRRPVSSTSVPVCPPNVSMTPTASSSPKRSQVSTRAAQEVIWRK